MTSSEIISLVSAGYSKAEIEAMSSAPAADPQTEAAQAPADDPQTEAAQAPAADPQPVQYDRIAVLENAIVKLTQAIQGANILNSGSDPVPTLTAEDALASLIKK